MSKDQYGELHYAAKNFFEHGFAFATLSNIVNDSKENGIQISESTLIRRYRHKHGIFNAVMEIAARRITDRFTEEIQIQGLNLQHSEPRRLVIAYLAAVLAMWQGDGLDKWLVGLAFGYDGMPAGEIEREGKVIFSDVAMGDVILLDSLLVRACGGDSRRAMNVSCIILGALEEFIYAGMIKCAAYDRKYDKIEVLGLIEVLMAALPAERSNLARSPSEELAAISAALRDQAESLGEMARQVATREAGSST